MTYDDIAAIFLAPLDGPIVEPALPPTPARRLRDALEPIATQGWWSRPAGEGLMALGVDFFPGYVWGRAAALGSPTPSVVAATFGVFEPRMIQPPTKRASPVQRATTSWQLEQPAVPQVSMRSQVLPSAPRSPIRCCGRWTFSTGSADPVQRAAFPARAVIAWRSAVAGSRTRP